MPINFAEANEPRLAGWLAASLVYEETGARLDEAGTAADKHEKGKGKAKRGSDEIVQQRRARQ